MNPQNQPLASQAPIPQAPSAPVVPPTPIGATSPNPVKSSGGRKRNLIFAFLGIVIVLIVAGAFGYYFLYMKNKPQATTYVAPEPMVTKSPSPTPEGTISTASDLDGTLSTVDDTTTEASMSQEATTFQADSNF